MSMTSANRVLLKDDPFQECQDLADLDFDFHQDYNSAAAVYNSCVDDLISGIGN
ncbi:MULTISPECIES: hypothetical protein [Bizionia]|nr:MULTISPECIES: hypothetical protein [Bizionia]